METQALPHLFVTPAVHFGVFLIFLEVEDLAFFFMAHVDLDFPLLRHVLVRDIQPLPHGLLLERLHRAILNNKFYDRLTYLHWTLFPKETSSNTTVELSGISSAIPEVDIEKLDETGIGDIIGDCTLHGTAGVTGREAG